MNTPKPKRKTRTSTAVKDRYNRKVYTKIEVREKKETAARFKERLKAEGKTIAGFFHKAIDDYLENKNGASV